MFSSWEEEFYAPIRQDQYFVHLIELYVWIEAIGAIATYSISFTLHTSMYNIVQ